MAQRPSGSDWTVQATDTIDSVVGTIRDKTVVPLTTIARLLVYGLIAGLLGIVAFGLVAVALIRVLVVYLPFHVGFSHARSVWAADAIVGGIFVILGWFFFLRKATAGKKR
jgi:hypothetical protein